MWLVFVGGIHEYEACHTLWIIRCEDANIEPGARGPDEHQRSGNPAAIDEPGELSGNAARCSG